MNDEEFHQQADQLARDIERSIAEAEKYITHLPEFEPRSDRKKAMQRSFRKKDGR